MKHHCPKCKEDFECIYPRCALGRIAICFVCFSKAWHVSAGIMKKMLAF
jgi:hypothetical protein